MQKSLVALSTIAALGLFACQPNTSDEAATTGTDIAETTDVSTESMTDVQKQAYAMGASMGLFVSNRAQQGEEVLRAKQQEMAQKAAQDNIEAGAAYLEENAKKDGVTTTDSGLQYEVLEEGEGASPAAEDIVKVHYRGTLLDGTEFDSSYKRGEPAEFPLNQVIPGWTEGVQLMKEGAKYRFHIPSDLAYGERATGSITPNSTLIFDVELLEVVKDEAAAE